MSSDYYASIAGEITASATGLVMRYERWRDANPADRLDPVLGPEIQIDLGQWAEEAAALLSRLLEHADANPFAAAEDVTP